MIILRNRGAHATMTTESVITIIKRDHNGGEVLRYMGDLIERSAVHVTIRAVFQHDDVDLGFVTFRRGDWLIEHFYTTRWYNVFELHSREDGALKGWYCNMARPAEVDGDVVSQDDLELDLWIGPDGAMQELDREEFEAQTLSAADRAGVEAGIAELIALAASREHPFDLPGS